MARVWTGMILVFMLAGCRQLTGPVGTLTDPSVRPPTAPAVSPSPTAASPAAVTGRVEVLALSFRSAPDGSVSGGSNPITISVTPAPQADAVRVGFIEDEVSGLGPMWRTAGWLAVATSDLLCGERVQGSEITFASSGFIDGPSAGCLMTVGVIAARRGDPIQPHVTMTGTINPDGSVGPVGGIPFKLQGARERGRKLVLLPIGTRFERHPKTGQPIDIRAAARKTGVEVREVTDVFEAYELITGKPLEEKAPPAPEPITPEEALRGLDKDFGYSYLQYKQHRRLVAPYRRVPFVEHVYRICEESCRTADKWAGQGLASPACHLMEEAETAMAALWGVVDVLRSRTPHQTAQQHGNAAWNNLAETVEALQGRPMDTVSETLSLADGYGAVAIALGLMAHGDRMLAVAQKAPKYAAICRVRAVYAYEMGRAMLRSVLRRARRPVILPGGAPCDEQALKQAVRIMQQAAQANLEYFDALIISERASALGIDASRYRDELVEVDSGYAAAFASRNAFPLITNHIKGKRADVARLGASLVAYIYSADAIARYYSLGEERNKAGVTTGVERTAALIHMLDYAQARARLSISRVKSEVAQPYIAIEAYHYAKVAREGNASGKLNALRTFWRATMHAELLNRLAVR